MTPFRSRRPRVPALAAILAVCAVPLAAQSRTGSLSGAVRADGDGRPVAEATVLLVGTPLQTATNLRGEYRFADLEPGRYALRVAATGFESAIQRDVDLAVGQHRRVDFTLRAAVFELPGVVVTATRSTSRPGDTPASIAVLSDSVIQRRSAITVDDALPFVPGIIVNSGQLDIRGATGLARGVGSRVLMLLDGHRVLAGADGSINFDLLPVLDIDRIEVVKGPLSTLYGSNALGGVVNLITRPIPERPETAIKTHVGLYDPPTAFRYTDETLTLQGVDLQHARRLGPVGAQLAAGRKTSDGFRQNGDYSRWFLRGRLVLPVTSPTPWDVYAVWAREDHGEFVTWRASDRPYEVDPPEAVGDWVRSDKLNVGATVTPVATRGLLVRLRPHLHRNAVQNYYHDNQNYHRTTRLGMDAQASLNPLRTHAITAGAEAMWTGVRSNFLGTPDLYDLAVFVHDEIELSDRFRASLGIRLDHRAAEGSADEFAVSPKVGLVYGPSGRTSLRLSFGRGYRAPSAVEQFVSTTLFNFRIIPNPALQGETSWGGEIGITTAVVGRLALDAAVFHTEYVDLIEPTPVLGQLFTFQFGNVARARVRGLDVGTEVSIVPDRLNFALTYTLLDTRDRRSNERLPYRSAHNLTATLDGGIVAVDVRYRSRVQRVLVYPLDARGAVTLVDLRLGYRIASLGVQAKIANVFQQKYADVQERNPGAPRSVLLTVLQRF